MPTSVKRHNLQRLRQKLGVTQIGLADWVGRTWSTIKSIETGKLALSDNLATLIASVTGVDDQWLLRNDLSEPMPPLRRSALKPVTQNNGHHQPNNQQMLLVQLTRIADALEKIQEQLSHSYRL